MNKKSMISRTVLGGVRYDPRCIYFIFFFLFFFSLRSTLFAICE